MGYSYLANGVPSPVQRPPGASSPSAFILKNVQSSELLPLSPFPSKALCVGRVLSSPTLPSPAQGLLTFLPSLSCVPLEMRFLESPIRDSVQMGFQGASCLEQASHPSPPFPRVLEAGACPPGLRLRGQGWMGSVPGQPWGVL